MFDFPNAPTLGQVATTPAGVTFTWDGTKWVSGGATTVSISQGTGIVATPNPITGSGTIALTSPVAIANGGTNATVAGAGADNLHGFAGATAGLVRRTGAAAYALDSAAYLVSPVDLTSQVTGVLPVANGGTGSSTAAAAPWVEVSGDSMTGKLTVTVGTLPALETRGVVGNPPTSGTTRTAIHYFSQTTDTGAGSVGILTGGGGFWLQSHDANNQANQYPLRLNPSGGTVCVRTGTTGVPTNAGLVVAGQAAAGMVVSQIWSGPAGTDTGTWMMAYYAFDGSTVVGGVARNGSNTVAFNTSSDARLKENIVETNIGLAELLQLKVRDYNFKGDERQEHGLIAQEVVDVYPLSVRPGGDDPRTDPWMIEYGRLVPLLIKAVQELAARVSTLEAGR